MVKINMGKLITIDGPDGAGKNTQSALLCDYLTQKGHSVHMLSFPDYENESSALVRMYLSGALGKNPADTNAYAASMLFAADRYISYRTKWEKYAHDPDTVIIANRYTTANAVHQLAKLGRELWDEFLSWLWDFEFSRLGVPKPDLILYFDIPPAASMRLVDERSRQTGQKKDIHELDREYIENCYTAAQFAANRLKWHIISCCEPLSEKMRTKEDIFDDIVSAVSFLSLSS